MAVIDYRVYHMLSMLLSSNEPLRPRSLPFGVLGALDN